MRPIVAACGLSVRYPDAAQPVLYRLSFELHPGERVLLLGPSGSGKSTLALCLNGVVPQSIEAQLDGQLRVRGHDPWRTAVPVLAREVGIVFQNPATQFCTLTVEDELAFGLENLAVAREQMPQRIQAALEWVGMPAAGPALLATLSGGEQQRIALAATLIMEPQLLVLDEVTANLDPAGAAQVIESIAHLARRDPHRALLIIAHQIEPLLDLITRVIVLDAAGGLAYDGSPRAVFEQHGPALAALGVWQPAACELARELDRAGVPLARFPLTLPEALEQIAAQPRTWPAAARWAQPGALPLPPDTPPAVEVERASFAYPSGRQALSDVSLCVRRGEVLGLLGANGSGKTTLAQTIAGLLRPHSGRVRVLGRDLAQMPLRDLARRCGFVFQNPEHQFVTDRVYDELAFGLRRAGYGEATIAARVEELLARLKLTGLRDMNPFVLSEGQKRRLSVATMLMPELELLVLDEPTFGQDAATTAELVAALRQLNAAGVTLVLVTHDMDLTWQLAHRVVVLSAGRVLVQGATETVLCDAGLLRQARLTLPQRAQVARAVAQAHTSAEVRVR